MRLDALLYLYARWVRAHPVQELCAGLGIAIGVALALAVLVANGSVAGSTREVTRALVGNADVQLVARHSLGFDERLLARVRGLPGVAQAAPVLEQRAILVGPGGRRAPVVAAGVDPTLAALFPAAIGNLGAGGLRLTDGIMLPLEIGRRLGLPGSVAQAVGPRERRVSLELRGRRFPVRVTAMLGPETVGPLAGAIVAIAPLPYLQRLAGLPRRLTRVLVRAAPGREDAVRAGLAGIAAGRLTVASADAEVDLLEQASGPANQASAGFALIGAVVGFLLAFNAMLLTAPQRRRLVADLRIQGFTRPSLVQMQLVQAAFLGIVASAAGLLAGVVLARTVFDQTPAYLAAAFPLGTETVVGAAPLLVSFAAGLVATCLAVVPPLLQLRRSGPAYDGGHRDVESTPALDRGLRLRLLAAALVLVAATSAPLLVTSNAAFVAVAGLAFATPLAIPAVFAVTVRSVEGAATRARRLSALAVALLALRSTTVRSLALAATGAVAVFGAVAIGGAREDLLRGIDRYTEQYVSTADLWILQGADDQATKDFRPGDLPARVAAVPGVRAVRKYRGAFLDFGGRRVWVIARPEADRPMIPAGEILSGDAASATARLRAGGWITVSDRLAADRGVGPGDTLALPTPTGEVRYRVAATTTNFGWTPGSIVMGSADYRRAWASSYPTALEVDLLPGAHPEAAKRAVRRRLGAGTALRVQTAGERAAQGERNARQGLQRLGQISALLLLTATLAMAAAMGAAIWQRRAGLASLRLQSFRPAQLWRVLLIESAVVLAAGCLTGAVVGVYGQALIDRYLRLTSGFPVSYSIAWQTVEIFVAVVLAALAAVAVPGRLAARAPPSLGLQE